MLHNLLTTNYSLKPNPQRGSITLILSAMILIGGLIGSVALSPITNFDTRQQAYEDATGGSRSECTGVTQCNPGQTSCSGGKYYKCIMYSMICSPSGIWRFESNSCPNVSTPTANDQAQQNPNSTTVTPPPNQATPNPNQISLVCYDNKQNCNSVTLSGTRGQTCRDKGARYFSGKASCQSSLTTATAPKAGTNSNQDTEGNQQTNTTDQNCGGSYSNANEIVMPGKCDYRGAYIANRPNQNLQICVRRQGNGYFSFDTPTADELASCSNNLTESSRNRMIAPQNASCGNVAHNTYACETFTSCILCNNGTKETALRSQCTGLPCYQAETAPATNTDPSNATTTQESTVTNQTLCYSLNDRCTEGEPRDTARSGPCESVGKLTLDRCRFQLALQENENRTSSNGNCFYGVSSCSVIGRETLAVPAGQDCSSPSASYCGARASTPERDPRCANATGVTTIGECSASGALLACDPQGQVQEVRCTGGRQCRDGACFTVGTVQPEPQNPQGDNDNEELVDDDVDATNTETNLSGTNNCRSSAGLIVLAKADNLPQPQLSETCFSQSLSDSLGVQYEGFNVYQCVQNARNSSNTCTCNTGYTQQGSTCVANGASRENNCTADRIAVYQDSSNPATASYTCIRDCNQINGINVSNYISSTQTAVQNALVFCAIESGSGYQVYHQCAPFFTKDGNTCRLMNTNDVVQGGLNILGNIFNNDEQPESETEPPNEPTAPPPICNLWFVNGICSVLGLNNNQASKQPACIVGDFSCREVPVISGNHHPLHQRHECVNLPEGATWVNLESSCLGNENTTEQSRAVLQNSESCSNSTVGTISCRQTVGLENNHLSNHECVQITQGNQSSQGTKVWVDLGSTCKHHKEEKESASLKPVYWGYTDELGNDNTISCITIEPAQPICASSLDGQHGASFECIQRRWIKISDNDNGCTLMPQLTGPSAQCQDGTTPGEIRVDVESDGNAVCFKRQFCSSGFTDYTGVSQITLDECLEAIGSQLGINPSNTPNPENVPSITECPGNYSGIGDIRYSRDLNGCYMRVACDQSAVPTVGPYWTRFSDVTTEAECNQITYQQQANIAQSSSNYNNEEEQIMESDCWYHLNGQNQCFRGFGNICSQLNVVSFPDSLSCEQSLQPTQSANITSCPAGQTLGLVNLNNHANDRCFTTCTDTTNLISAGAPLENATAVCADPESGGLVNYSCNTGYKKRGGRCVRQSVLDSVGSVASNTLNTILNRSNQQPADTATTCPAGQYKENGTNTGEGPCFIGCTQPVERLITEDGQIDDSANSFLCIMPGTTNFYGQCNPLYRKQGNACVNIATAAVNNVTNTILNRNYCDSTQDLIISTSQPPHSEECTPRPGSGITVNDTQKAYECNSNAHAEGSTCVLNEGTNETSDSSNPCDNGDARYARTNDGACYFRCTFPTTIGISNTQTPPENSFFCTDSGNKRRIQCTLFHRQEGQACVPMTPTQVVSTAAATFTNTITALFGGSSETDDQTNQETTTSQPSEPFFCNFWIIGSFLCGGNQTEETAEIPNHTIIQLPCQNMAIRTNSNEKAYYAAPNHPSGRFVGVNCPDCSDSSRSVDAVCTHFVVDREGSICTPDRIDNFGRNIILCNQGSYSNLTEEQQTNLINHELTHSQLQDGEGRALNVFCANADVPISVDDTNYGRPNDPNQPSCIGAAELGAQLVSCSDPHTTDCDDYTFTLTTYNEDGTLVSQESGANTQEALDHIVTQCQQRDPSITEDIVISALLGNPDDYDLLVEANCAPHQLVTDRERDTDPSNDNNPSINPNSDTAQQVHEIYEEEMESIGNPDVIIEDTDETHQ